MRQFFKNEFKTLEIKTGLKQYDRIMERDTHEQDLNELLDILCRVCAQFPFIPEGDQMNIIKQNIITDQEFTGFNAKIVYKWLASAKHLYFKEQAHIDSKAPDGYKVLEGADRQKRINEWLAALGDGVKQVPHLTETEIKREGRIDVMERKGTSYQSSSIDELKRIEMHRQYALHNYEVRTGDKLPEWMEESQWLELNKEELETWWSKEKAKHVIG